MLQSLRRAGGSLVMTVPKAFIEQNNLHEGSKVNLHLAGEQLTITAPSHSRKQYRIADLVASVKGELPRVDGWDDMAAMGKETAI